MAVTSRQSSRQRAWSVDNAARNVRPCVTVSSPAQKPEKNYKRALQCARCLTKSEPAGSIRTYAHIPSPHLRQRRKCHSEGVEITLNNLASLATIRLRGLVMAANRNERRATTIQ